MFIYRDKKTNKKIKSATPLKDKDLVLVREFRDMKMKTDKISKK